MTAISASMLASNFARMGEEACRMQAAGADFLHMDVMDGRFVPNISFGADVIRAVHAVCSLPLDVHLMVEDPDRYAETFVRAGATFLTVHAECTPHLQRALRHIRDLGARPGLALNPATPLDAVRYVLDDIDLLLVMTVNPGFGGQKLIPATVEKTREAAQFVMQKIDSARWFMEMIRQRKTTMLRIMQAVVDYQHDYFLEGDIAKLKPMRLKDIAEKVGMDISTVSRVINNKYIQTHFGTFLVKEFFSQSTENEEGEEISTSQVKAALQHLVDKEDKRSPLTDDELESALRQQGFVLARRTVAKYREGLGIPIARMRKQL